MKNVNFSPSARHRSSKCRLRKKVIRYGILISLTLLIAVFWHRHVDMYQCRLPLSKAPQSNAPQSNSPQKAVQLDSPDKGDQDAARPPAERSPSVQEGTAEEGAGQEGAVEERAVQEATGQKGAVQEGTVQQGTVHEGTIHEGAIQQGAAQENASSAKVSSKMEDVSPKVEDVSPKVEDVSPKEVSPKIEKIDRMKTATGVDKEGNDEGEDEGTDEGTGYYIKVYSSVIRDDAEKAGVYLTQMKYSPQIIRESGFAVMRNVYVTPNSPGIQETVDRLSSDGFSVYLQEDLQSQENQYAIRAGSCYYLESAKSLLKSLKYKGYSGNIIQEKTAVKFYSVFLGKYSDFEAALEEQRQLSLKGFPMSAVTSGIPAGDK